MISMIDMVNIKAIMFYGVFMMYHILQSLQRYWKIVKFVIVIDNFILSFLHMFEHDLALLILLKSLLLSNKIHDNIGLMKIKIL